MVWRVPRKQKTVSRDSPTVESDEQLAMRSYMVWGLGAERAWGVPGQRKWLDGRAWPAPRVCGSLVGAPSLLRLLWGPWGKQKGGWHSRETFGVEPMHLR